MSIRYLIEDLKEYFWQNFFMILVVALICATASGIIAMELHKQRVVLPKAYAAWAKQTGNPKAITFEEWNLLRETLLLMMR